MVEPALIVDRPGTQVYHGDCVRVMQRLASSSVDAVVTDPPYGLDFMGKDWDAPWKGTKMTPARAFQEWSYQWLVEAYRVLKPGGHLLAFGGTRMYHRMVCAAEDAGFEIRDCVAWLYGTGFPKSLDVSKAIDKRLGTDKNRPVLGERQRGFTPGSNEVYGQYSGDTTLTGPGSQEAAEWEGWGTGLKPSFEPIVVARKPVEGSVAENVLRYGTGALNIDGCRIGEEARFLLPFDHGKPKEERTTWFNASPDCEEYEGKWVAGRWPANAILDGEAADDLDRQSGVSVSKRTLHDGGPAGDILKSMANREPGVRGHNDSGGASRFFYIAKPDAGERVKVGGAFHPTVKPLDLMRWLVRLVTRPDGLVLEPFAGSGATVEACLLEGVRCVASEITEEYLPLIEQRLDRQHDPVAAVKRAGEDPGLFEFL